MDQNNLFLAPHVSSGLVANLHAALKCSCVFLINGSIIVVSYKGFMEEVIRNSTVQSEEKEKARDH